jgi:hypothetical protein
MKIRRRLGLALPRFADPEGSVAYIREQGPRARVRPDMKVVRFEDWETPEQRLRDAAAILRGSPSARRRRAAAQLSHRAQPHRNRPQHVGPALD